MMSNPLLQLVMFVLGGVGLFLLGMKFLSEGMQTLAGPRLSKLVNCFTGNRVFAVLSGIGVAFAFQSSSAATVMVVGFVNSGLLSLLSALGVSLGANIGTTISLWVLTLNITKFGLLLVGLASFLYLFSKTTRPHNIGRALLGLGMLFYGMQLMSSGVAPLRENESVIQFLAQFDATTLGGFLLAVLASSVITGIIQSSAAMVVIVMSLAVNGIINFPTSVALVLGSNIGTTVTGLIACIGANRMASRAAIGNMAFNVIGVLIALCFHGAFVGLCRTGTCMMTGSGSDCSAEFMRVAIPFTHTVFNLCITLVLLPTLHWLERALMVILPKTEAEQRNAERFQTVSLDSRLVRTPVIAVAQSQREIVRMCQHCGKMLEGLRTVLFQEKPDEALEQSIFDAEEDLDVAQADLSRFFGQILESGGAKQGDVAVSIRRQIRCSDEFESVADYVQTALKALLKVRNAGEKLSEVAVSEVKNLIDAVQAFRMLTEDVLSRETPPTFQELATAHKATRRIHDLAKDYRHRHMDRLAHSCTGPVKGVIYNDLLVAFRRMNDHLINVIETYEGK